MSAIIFCDGFDTYTTVLDKWDAVIKNSNSAFTNLTVSIIPGSGRGGAGALNVPNHTDGSSSVPTFYQAQKNIGAHTTLFIGFAFYVDTTTQVGDTALCQLNDGSTNQVSLWITKTGTMYFTRGATSGTNILATASIPYPSSSFHYVEIKVTIDGSAGVCQLKVDQVTVPGMNVTGVNTKVSANNSFDAVLLGCYVLPASTQQNYLAYFDDVYFDTAGFNGDVRINGQLPTGDGTTQNFAPIEATWVAAKVTPLQTTIFDGTNLQRCTAITGTGTTGGSAPSWNGTLGGTTTDNAGANQVIWTNIGTVAHWKLVSETNPDGDSSYVQSNTVNDIERFTFPAIVGANIATVIVWAFCRKDDGGLRTIQGNTKSGSTVGNSGTDVAPGTNYAYLMLQFINDPNTGSAWTLAAVNAAEFGVKITN